MSTITILSPTAFSLSGNAAIEAILTDIPLFCEGIMGIGVFTFLFITKQVNLLSVFLYGSSFMAFVAATLDLGQVLARGSTNTARGVGLDAVDGFIKAREVFLSLAVLFLNLFFWRLVACCPRGEVPDESDQLANKRRLYVHSASWNRWGLVGEILKWVSLSALLTAPILQMVWRLFPSQRQYASVYVAESTIQTTVTAIFILKFILNVYISPLEYWWHAFRVYIAPMTALVIGTCLGIGNLVLFSFTETSLGRFLRAVEVYILILHSLYTAFQAVSDTVIKQNVPSLAKGDQEKTQYRTVLPLVYDLKGGQLPKSDPSESLRRIGENQVYSGSLALPQSISEVEFPQPRLAANTNRSVLSASDNIQGYGDRFPNFDIGTSFPSPLPFLNPSFGFQQPSSKQRPPTTVSLSYYSMEQGSPKTPTQAIPDPNSRAAAFESAHGANRTVQQAAPRPPSGNFQFGSQQGSVTSLDEILRQQTELDNSIAALRLFSTRVEASIAPTSMIEATPKTADFSIERSKNPSNGANSPSNRSEFSLSIFPDPPIISKTQIITKYSEERLGSRMESNEKDMVITRPKDMQPIIIPPALGSGATTDSALQFGLSANIDSAGTQYDVTSFIGDMFVGPSTAIPNIDDRGSDGETLTITTAIVLRPMLLASMISATPERPVFSASTYGPGQTAQLSPSTPESGMPLRPLLLGTALSSVPPLPQGMVPFAQRRARGGTISSATRRPVISGPRLTEGADSTPGAFERPRPPPLRLNGA